MNNPTFFANCLIEYLCYKIFPLRIALHNRHSNTQIDNVAVFQNFVFIEACTKTYILDIRFCVILATWCVSTDDLAYSPQHSNMNIVMNKNNISTYTVTDIYKLAKAPVTSSLCQTFPTRKGLADIKRVVSFTFENNPIFITFAHIKGVSYFRYLFF